MNRIVIIGGGFVGLNAARTLSGHHASLDITLITSHGSFDFLPLLPDVISGKVPPNAASTPLSAFPFLRHVRCIEGTVTSLDPVNRTLSTRSTTIPYDYAIVASGTETNFYGRADAAQNAFRLDTVQDAIRLRNAARSGIHSSFVVSGGGYTGIEVSTHLRHLLAAEKRHVPVLVIERGPSVVGVLPEWMRQYVRMNLARLRIDPLENTEVTSIDPAAVRLSNGRALEKACVVWVAGVKTPAYIQALPFVKNAQGRLGVDPFLRLDDHLFAAGDSALVQKNGAPLRMSVQFAFVGGQVAATNILRSIDRRPLRPFNPADPGYVVPMANGLSCGSVFGIPLRGRLPSLLHYVMCAFRTPGISRRLSILKNLSYCAITLPGLRYSPSARLPEIDREE